MAVKCQNNHQMFSKELFLTSVFLFTNEKPQTIRKQLSYTRLASITGNARPPSCFCLPWLPMIPQQARSPLLSSNQVLIATLNHVAPHVSRRTQMLDPFQEFVMVLMKLRLNVPFQDLDYRFMVSVPTVSQNFWSWINAMDNRLSGLLHWTARENLWKTMCFKYAFGNKVTVVIDSFEVFIEKPTNLLAQAQTFSYLQTPQYY